MTDQSDTPERKRRLVLIAGATGYVGGRLLAALEDRNVPVRCLARKPEGLAARVAPGTQVVRGDVLDPASLRAALQGVDTAYYLVHSLGASADFEDLDRQGARNFAEAAERCGVRRIIYLGGLGNPREALSPHLRSRQETGHVLRSGGVRVIEFRASILLGSGSLSFEMVRALVERLPVLVTPRWVSLPAQPLAIADAVAYLVTALDVDCEGHRVFEIGGRDRASYAEIMAEYARQRGLRRLTVPVPVLTPWLSSLWLQLVTPVYARIGRRLIDSICHATVVNDDSAIASFDIRPLGLREALYAALRCEDGEFAATRWSDALSAVGPETQWGGVRFGNRLIDSRTTPAACSVTDAFRAVERIGGSTGWYYGDRLWRLRGILDALVGGVGLRRGRRDPNRLWVGDTVDFWRVDAIEPPRVLRLAAEMRLPGRAWLEFEVTEDAAGVCVRQTAIFDPVGLMGLAYWYVLYPLHQMVFAGMLRGIAAAAQGAAAAPHG